MTKMLPLFAAALVGIVIGAVGVTQISAQNAPQITRTEILRKPMSGIEGKELVLFIADVPAGAVAGRHYHPGDEASYMLQGSLEYTPDHDQPFEVKAGEVMFNPAKHIHQAKNVSASEPAKVLTCIIAEKGLPLTIPAP